MSSIPPKSIIKNEPLSALISLTDADFRPDASWSLFTSFGVGTASFFLLRLRSAASSELWVPRFRQAGYRFFPLGGGTNLVGSDRTDETRIFLQAPDDPPVLLPDGTCSAGGRCPLRTFLKFALDRGLGGTAPLSGIPGSLGGAVRMNAGANGACVSDFLEEIVLLHLDDGTLSVHKKPEFPWHYRDSGIPPDRLILSARFRFPRTADPAGEEAAWAAERERRLRAPKGRSAGSIFRNPGNGLPPAGRLLEDAGAKGMREGAFRVSEQHANWIVNTGPGEALPSDLLRLMERMRQAVYEKTSILLHAEVRFADMESEKKKKVLVVMGGESSEREISLSSGRGVSQALRNAGYDVRGYDIRRLELTPDMTEWADVVFPVLHGGYGEDGRFQALLEKAGVCFVGPSSRACRIIMDKELSKDLMLAGGISTPAYRKVKSPDDPIPEGFSLPLIVKPNSNGSTFGVTLVETPSEWKSALEEAFRYDSEVFVEEYIKGVEGSIGIVAGKPLPIVEIQFPGKIYDYDAKYNAASPTRHPCPPENMTPAQQEEVARIALAYAEKVGAESLVRVDVIVRSSDGKAFILEGNGLPGMTPTSLVPTEAKTAGISMEQLCASLVESASVRSPEDGE